jgi:hypothetical protein
MVVGKRMSERDVKGKVPWPSLRHYAFILYAVLAR